MTNMRGLRHPARPFFATNTDKIRLHGELALPCFPDPPPNDPLRGLARSLVLHGQSALGATPHKSLPRITPRCRGVAKLNIWRSECRLRQKIVHSIAWRAGISRGQLAWPR